MKVKEKTKTTSKVVITLNEKEAAALESFLSTYRDDWHDQHASTSPELTEAIYRLWAEL